MDKNEVQKIDEVIAKPARVMADIPGEDFKVRQCHPIKG